MWNRKRLLLLAVFVGLPAVFLFWRYYWLRWSADKLILSKETTYITSPLDEAGYPDYYAALNEHLSQGVTPENNAAVPLLQAFGPGILPDDIDRAEFLHLLRMKPFRRTGRHFEDWITYGMRIPENEIPNLKPDESSTHQDRLWVIEAEITKRPWQRDEFPHAASWLEAQREYLDLVVAASQRPRFFVPVVRQGQAPLLTMNTGAMLNAARQAVLSLNTRSLLRIGERDFDAAWADLMACHRLARLYGQGPFVQDVQLGWVMDGGVFDAEAVFLGAAELSAKQWSALRADVDALPAHPPLTDKLDQGERYALLDTVCFAARNGVRAIDDALFTSQEHAKDQPSPFAGVVGAIDWNVPLRMANERMDREAAAARIDDPLDRSTELSALAFESQAAMAAGQDGWQFFRSIFSQRAASERMGEIFIGMRFVPLFYANNAEVQSRAYLPLIRIGLALGQYQAENRMYPSKLKELAPRYLDRIPLDPFTGLPFSYRKTDDGYRLHSVGRNGKDDAGKTDDAFSDDLLIEVPWKAKPKPTDAKKIEQ